MIPWNIIANADDLGLSNEVNQGILTCFEKGYINSTSLLTNTGIFEETVNLIENNPSIKNIGVHINLAEGKPVSNFTQLYFLNNNGDWNISRVSKKIRFLNTDSRAAFFKEISAQIEKALTKKIPLKHLDSHYHLHVLPGFGNLFIEAAKLYNLKLRLAQTSYNGNVPAFLYRRIFNNRIRALNYQYADYFESMHDFRKNRMTGRHGLIEIMLHPALDNAGKLTDHYDTIAVTDWISYLHSLN